MMTFFKSLLLAIFATVFLTYVLGVSFLELLNINVYMDGELIAPLKAIGVSAVATVILVLIAVAMVAIGVFWPVLLIAVVIWLVTRNKQVSTKKETQYS
jgi:hypothetical protein